MYAVRFEASTAAALGSQRISDMALILLYMR